MTIRRILIVVALTVGLAACQSTPPPQRPDLPTFPPTGPPCADVGDPQCDGPISGS